MEAKVCVVFLCNVPYFNKFIYTCNLLRTAGQYGGDICLVVGNCLKNHPVLNSEFMRKNGIIVKYFPDAVFSGQFLQMQNNLARERHWTGKMFHYHKFRLFDVFFKQWDWILYLDCGISIFSSVLPILGEIEGNPAVLMAHSDAHPDYKWKLGNQFDKTQAGIFDRLNRKYDLNCDYFQTTMMLYNTQIIEENTWQDLMNLLSEFPISITNDQGIVSLYFTKIRPLFRQIRLSNEETFFYDYLSRGNEKKYIMLKSSPSSPFR